MKFRSVHTKIWQDEWFSTLSRAGKLVFLYTITNPNIGMTGMYELPDRVVCFDTGLNQSELEDVKKELVGKVRFEDGWVYVINSTRYNTFRGEQLKQAEEKEASQIPKDVYTALSTGKPYGVSMPHGCPMDASISYPILSSNKKRGVGERTYTDRKLTLDQVAEGIVRAFNINLKRNFKVTNGFKPALKEWLDVYTPQEIEKAIRNIRLDDFWCDKMTPTILFRRKNPQGEAVDYISQLLNLSN